MALVRSMDGGVAHALPSVRRPPEREGRKQAEVHAELMAEARRRLDMVRWDEATRVAAARLEQHRPGAASPLPIGLTLAVCSPSPQSQPCLARPMPVPAAPPPELASRGDPQAKPLEPMMITTTTPTPQATPNVPALNPVWGGFQDTVASSVPPAPQSKSPTTQAAQGGRRTTACPPPGTAGLRQPPPSPSEASRSEPADPAPHPRGAPPMPTPRDDESSVQLSINTEYIAGVRRTGSAADLLSDASQSD
eukprot:TRINITY_DN26301_c0_g1_i1.p1 TRINITY_DN26301_c0_g1~~TRINITY_DN26301_c0_g1_i1.p1  ORF type:complete len:279 (+),score=47.77 TRINITY_DN26301_c0_g1_i1:88-837(+)